MVGMPSAYIASLMMYSRSIGPSAARPSPRRENRVCPAPFNWMSTPIARRRALLAQQDRAAVAEHGEVAELVPGVRLRDRPRPFRQDIAGEDRRAGGTVKSVRIESEHRRERPVEGNQLRLANPCRRRR